ncbi:hypothetical protein [Nonomuraea endophytica]|uniref:hypothetical protein n=1 Tax=Nonomuraea endophytica TaxID=714136 RepID=UPI0037C778B3
MIKSTGYPIYDTAGKPTLTSPAEFLGITIADGRPVSTLRVPGGIDLVFDDPAEFDRFVWQATLGAHQLYLATERAQRTHPPTFEKAS